MVQVIENVEKEAREQSGVVLATSVLLRTKLAEIKQLNQKIEETWTEIEDLQKTLDKSITTLRNKWNVTVEEES